MAIKDLKKSGTQQKQEPGYGVVLEVKKATKTSDGGVEVTGVILTSSAFGKAGDKVVLAGDEKALTNLENGGAKFNKPTAAAGTVLLLERARSKGLGEGGVRTITADYLTTISSPSKNYGDMGRGFKQAMASAPVISFPNVKPLSGEPKTIAWATNTPGITRRVKEGNDWKTKIFDTAWLREKYAEAVGAGKKAKVYLDTFDPSNALPATTAGDVADTIRALSMQSKNSVVLLRAFDEQASVLTRKIPIRSSKVGDEWIPDPDKTIEYCAENGYFKGVSNEALFDDIAKGESGMEVIPGERLFYPGDSADFVIKKSLANPPKNGDGAEYNVMSFTFGDRANNVAKVVIAGMLPPDGGFVPLNMVRDEPGVVGLREMATPNRQAVAGDQHQALAHDDMVSDDDMSLGDEMGMGDEEFGVHSQHVDDKQSASSSAPGM